MSSSISLTLHACNRLFEREVPIEALSLLPLVASLLTDKPLKVIFRNAGITMITRKATDGRPRLISAWHHRKGKGESSHAKN